MSHSYISLFVHIVWSTKGRIPYFSTSGKERLYLCLKENIEKQKVELLAIGSVSDHVHVLVDGLIVRSGGKELALELEERGYGWLEGEMVAGERAAS